MGGAGVGTAGAPVEVLGVGGRRGRGLGPRRIQLCDGCSKGGVRWTARSREGQAGLCVDSSVCKSKAEAKRPEHARGIDIKLRCTAAIDQIWPRGPRTPASRPAEISTHSTLCKLF